MTADKLQSIVLRFANSMPTRYWLHFNYPAQRPWFMAIRVIPRSADRNELVSIVKGFRDLGFARDEHADVWTIERTNDDGTPFTSPL